jgi:hypothetical protein
MKGRLNRVSFRVAALAAVCSCLVSQAFATAPTLPTTGVDVDGFITATITALGTVVAVAVGGYFAFLLIKKGLMWGRKALA